MKKTGLFKFIMIVILVAGIITWLVPALYWGGTGLVDLDEKYIVGFFDFFQLGFGAFQFDYFLQIAILLLSIGAFYGVLSKTGKYRSLLEKIAIKLKGKEKIFLIITAFVLAGLTSAFGYGLIMFLFIPALISIILLMGFDKVTAFLATIGAVLIGDIGATLSGNTVKVINDALGITGYSTGIYAKLALFTLAFIVLVVFIFKAKVSKNSTKDESYNDSYLGEKKANKSPVWPIYTLFAFLFVLVILACTPWVEMFNVNVFTKMNTAITGFTINGFPIFKNLLGTISPLGEWYYSEISIMCLLSSFLIAKIYKIKFSDAMDNMFEGAAKLVKPALLIMLAYVVVYIAGNTLFFNYLADTVLKITSGFNIFISSIVMIFASLFHVDLLYVASYVLPYFAGTYPEAVSTIAIMTQGLYGITMFILPTSAFLILGLSYLEISYKEWLKKSWKFIVTLLLVVLAVVVVFALV